MSSVQHPSKWLESLTLLPFHIFPLALCISRLALVRVPPECQSSCARKLGLSPCPVFSIQETMFAYPWMGQKKGALVTKRIRPPPIPLRWGQPGYMHLTTHTILLTLDIKFSTNIDADAQTILHRTPVLSRKFSRGLQAQLLPLINSPPIFNPQYFWRRVASRIATKLYCLAFNDCLIRWFWGETWWIYESK